MALGLNARAVQFRDAPQEAFAARPVLRIVRAGLRSGGIDRRGSADMQITVATSSDLEQAVGCLVAAFAQDPITGFLLQAGPGYAERVTQFFSLLMRARIELSMPVLTVRDASGIHGAAMGYTTARPAWPRAVANDWDHFETAVAGLTDRMAVYDAIADQGKPSCPHYYLGVIGVDPARHGLGIGSQLLQAFCERSASDPSSGGVYLETANPSNVPYYEKAGFAVTGQGRLGNATLWCMFLDHRPLHDTIHPER